MSTLFTYRRLFTYLLLAGLTLSNVFFGTHTHCINRCKPISSGHSGGLVISDILLFFRRFVVARLHHRSSISRGDSAAHAWRLIALICFTAQCARRLTASMLNFIYSLQCIQFFIYCYVEIVANIERRISIFCLKCGC